jgi:sugar lactone lactonase YvrE
MNFLPKLPAILLGTVVTIAIPQLAVGLSPTEVNGIAQQITVRIDGANTGSGVIVDKQGNTYTVVTNWHVVEQSGTYTVQTSDGKRYQVNSSQIKRLGGVDLAVLQFSSEINYRQAELGNSERLSEGATVFVAGWAEPDRINPERGYKFLTGNLSGRVAKPKNGYGLVYTNVAKPGMSGGPVLNDEGLLVGINGATIPDGRTGDNDYFGIPIDTYIKLASVPRRNPPSTNPSPPVRTATALRSTTTTPAPTPRSQGNTPRRINNSVAYYSRSSFSLAKTLTGHSQPVVAIAISPNSQTLASGSGDRTIKIWNLATGEEIRTLSGHAREVNSVAISPNGQTLVSGSGDSTIKVWNLSTGAEIRTLKGHSESVDCVVISPDGQTLASGSRDGAIIIWNLSTGKQIRTLKGHSKWVIFVAFSPDGRTLTSSSHEKNIKIWNLTTGREIRTLTENPDLFALVTTVATSPDGRTLAVSGLGDSDNSDDTIEIWNLGTGKKIHTLSGHSKEVNSVGFSPDGQTLASGSSDKTIKIWNLATGKQIRTLKGHSADSVAFSPDGQTLASGGYDKRIEIWRVEGR